MSSRGSGIGSGEGGVNLTEADVRAVLDCLESGWLTMGPRTQELEGRIADGMDLEHVVGLASGYAAISLALRALRVGEGDRVVVAATAPLPVANAVVHQGAELVMCDVQPGAPPKFDPRQLARCAAGAKAVVASHAWGFAAELAGVEEVCRDRRVDLVEDALHAMFACDGSGRLAGTVAVTSCFDLSENSVLPVGEGGFLASRDESVAALARSLRSHAMTSVTWERHRGHGLGYDVTDVGFNYRIDEPRAALALSRLEHIADDLELRRRTAAGYLEVLADGGTTAVADGAAVARAAPLWFPVEFESVEARNEARSDLIRSGIDVQVPVPLHRLTAFSEDSSAEFPGADTIADRYLLLPCGPNSGTVAVEAFATAVAV